MSFQLEELKEHNSELLNLLTHHLPDMLWVKDVDGNYIYANKALCDGLLMAKDVNEPIGKGDVFFALRERELYKDIPDWHTFGELCFNSDVDVIEKNKPMKFEEYGNVKGKLMYLEVYKAPFYDKDGNVIGTVGAGRDITKLKKIQIDLQESLKILDEQKELLEYRANHDALTDLPNRILFMDRLRQSIGLASKNQNNTALLFIDLDHFKEINDSLGHYIGDKILIEFTKRMQTRIKVSDTISRLGGDEFCIILNNIQNLDFVSNFIVESMKLIEKPFVIGEKRLYISMSLGISIYPNDGKSATSLLKNADVAMYRAKESGRDTYAFYDEEMTKRAVERVYMETELRKALQEDELLVYFQPQIDARDDSLVGMEALARWNHPTMGMISPERFIPIAELTGMIVEVDRVIMTKAIEQFKEWTKEGLKPEKLAMNLAMEQIESSDFIEFLENLLKKLDCNYHNIELEVTENQIMKNPEKSIKTLKQLEKLNISLSVDDFGTGYSSLAYLKRLPIQKLKIDKSFVDDLPYDAEDVAISKTIISLCESLGLNVIAEGVEKQIQKEFLLENGCNLIQGYLYSHPLSAKDMTEYLKKKS